MPILSYQVNETGNKTSYTIKYEGFKNQHDEIFNTKKLEGNVVVSNFFFTRCPSICPPMQQTLLELAEDYRYQTHIMIISHTIDPKNDSIPILFNYWEHVCNSNKNWQFLYANDSLVKKQAIQYMTSFEQTEDLTDFYHSSYLTLLDKKQRIRGFYNSLVVEDMERLKNDIDYLLERD